MLPHPHPPSTKAKMLICLAIIIATMATYWQVTDHGFSNLDDNLYVASNPVVSQGLTFANIQWAFTLNSKHFYWQPLTWLSHMLDVQLFGLNPGPHHLVNVLIHIANSLLIFILLINLTDRLWNSAFVALLFALHPINVESIAWIAERKNVLSTFFWLLTMLAYVHYTTRQTVINYLTIVLVFGLGVLTKPMLVTLPFTLLLLDFWPLNRLALGQQERVRPQLKTVPALPLRLVIEKLPLIFLALAATFFVSGTTETIPFAAVPMDLRVANAIASYWHYLAKMFMPLNLAIYYNYPSKIAIWPTVGTALWLFCMTTLTLRAYRTRPHLTVGWLWYLGTLVPVLGFIQSGFWPAWADRWGYVPLLGIYIMISWSVPELVGNHRHKKTILTFGSMILLTVLAIGTRHQIKYWADDIKLYSHALELGSGNPIIYTNFGAALAEKNRTYEAIQYYQAALQQSGEHTSALNNLGIALAKLDRPDEAMRYFRKARRSAPNNIEVKKNLEKVLARQKKLAGEISNYQDALKTAPDSAELYNKLGLAQAKSGQIDEALQSYATAIEKEPGYKESYNHLGLVLMNQGYTKEAITFFEKALKIDPEYAAALNNITIASSKPPEEQDSTLNVSQ